MAQLRHDLVVAAKGACKAPADLDAAVMTEVNEGE
jgi:hypothetical protein